MCSDPTISMAESSVFAILGSGFGMYGYLPALIECGIKVVLPERYRDVVSGRSELVQYAPQISWCANVNEALARANGAVIATRPADQAEWLAQFAETPWIESLLLEKPIASEPARAARLLDMIEQAGKRYRVGYTFRFLPWAERLRAVLGEGGDGFKLDWSFMAHHFGAKLENWKRFDASGGGALRFYGIHLVALLAELGYDDVEASVLAGLPHTETVCWEATLTGKNLPPFALRVDSCSMRTCFRIVSANRGAVVDQYDPFVSVKFASFNVRDPRVDVLVRLCRSLDDSDQCHAKRQRDIVALWTRIEQVSQRVSRSTS